MRNSFGHSPDLAAKTFDEYVTCMDDRLKVDFKYLEKLVGQIAPSIPGGAQPIASEWITRERYGSRKAVNGVDRSMTIAVFNGSTGAQDALFNR